MSDAPLLYSSRISKVYLEYLKRYYPNLDIEQCLEFAGMTKYEIEDPAHWFTQKQTDLFNQSISAATDDPEISRKAGRYTVSTEGISEVKQYALGLLNLGALYMLMQKMNLLFSRGNAIDVKRLRANKIRIISTPKQGVAEKLYQCENRIGIYESMAKLFIQDFAHVEHPECVHKGDACCRYIVTWEKKRSLVFRQMRNLFLVVGTPILCGLVFVLPPKTWDISILSFGLITMILSFLYESFGRKEMMEALAKQGNPAKDLIAEMKIRHDNALLVQEVGTAISSVLDVDKIVQKVAQLIERHMDFDRGIILLADSRKTRLTYTAGYGYDREKKTVLQKLEFSLANPASQGVFTLAFKDQEPFLIDDVAEIEGKLSERSVQFVRTMNVRSLICVPIIYKNESLGILGVDNVKSKRPLTTSDVNLLMGVASQTAMGIMTALSFQKIQESEIKYRDLVENANSIIMRINTMGDITFFNEYAQQLFGYSESEITAYKVMDIFHRVPGSTGNHFGRLLEEFKHSPSKSSFNESQSELIGGKKVWIAWTCKPIYSPDGTPEEILCIGNDITVLKQTEKEKDELETRLLRAEKMEAIGTLAGGVAHDLNNILSGVVSYPQVLLRKLPEDSPLIRPILTIQNSGKRAAAIVQDLLTLARRGVVTREIVDFNAIIDEYLQSPEFKDIQIIHPHVQVKTDLLDNTLNIQGSPVHLSKTVMNLVTNAFEAIEVAGEVTISTENKIVDTLINGYDQVKNGNYVTLTVMDTGSGILPQDLERIFEPFYSKKVMGKSGTGLGMAVVWGTVKDHQGYIDVESTPGQGTCFTLYFPAVTQALPDTEAIVGIDGFMGKGESILIVDDMEEQRVIATEMLSMLGYTVQSVASGAEAVQYLRDHHVDLLVLDMIMDPGIDGLETYRQILEVKPGQKAIITSGYSETKNVKATMALGAGAYVKKPYLLEAVGKAVREELDNF